GVGGGFGQSAHGRDQPKPVSGGAEDHRAEGCPRQVGQDLPGIPAFPLLGEPECKLTAVSQAGGYPGHQKQRRQRGESGWASPGKKQETGRAPPPEPRTGGPRAGREPAPRSPASPRRRWPAVPGTMPKRVRVMGSALLEAALSYQKISSQFPVLSVGSNGSHGELRTFLLTADLNDP